MALESEIQPYGIDGAGSPPVVESRSVTILGATGSVGQSTIDLVAADRDRFPVVALTAQSNVDLLSRDARRLGAQLAVIGDADRYEDLKAALSGSGVAVAAGEAALCDAARLEADWVMSAIVGAAGIGPTMAAVDRGAMVAFANKECLVSAGPLMMERVRRSGAVLLPVDSEHNAVFQVFDDRQRANIERIILTASGGPFRKASIDEMAAATAAQAVAHPTWSMGAKISIDSATMMNKGLEIIEAAYLFDMKDDRISVVVHPQSIIHSLVAYTDGSMLAQLGSPDMRVPIGHVLGWPGRLSTSARRLDFADLLTLEFAPPDADRFPALDVCREALRVGKSLPTTLNAANEVAVAAFLAGKLRFLDIVRVVDDVCGRMPVASLDDLDHVFDIDRAARAEAHLSVGRLS